MTTNKSSLYKFQELKNKLPESYLLMKKKILHPETIWYRSTTNPVEGATEIPDYIWFCHGILRRPRADARYTEPVSSIAKLAMQALTEILQSNGKNPYTFHRVAVNLLPRQAKTTMPPAHVDHDFDYKHLLIYLNNADGDTVMFNSKKQIIDRSSPKEDKVIFFGKCLHSAHFPVKAPERIVLVATYT